MADENIPEGAVRALNEDGTFKTDNPNTPENEAYVVTEEWKIQVKLCQDDFGTDNALVRIEFDGEIITDNYEIVSTDMANPEVIEFKVLKYPGTYPLSVTFLNDSYVDSDNDRNVHWCGTFLEGGMPDDRAFYIIKWDEMRYDDEVITADLSAEGMGGWHTLLLTHQGTAEFDFPLPFPW